MDKVIIEKNGKVTIKHGDNYYRCTVKAVCEDNTFYVDKPLLKDNEAIKLEIDDTVYLDYYTEYGIYYEIETKVLGKILEDGELLYRFSTPIKFRKIQRRNFVRVIFTEYTLYRACKDYNWEKAILLDISGGGAKLNVKKELKMGEQIKIKFKYKEYESSLIAKVVRCSKAKENGYTCGLEFIGIDDRKRDKIVEKVFEIMRRQREIM